MKEKFAGSQVRRFKVQGSRFKDLALGTWNLEPIRRFAVVGVGLILLFLAATPASAQNMVTLFDIGAGVRPLGMGGAFTALADDENALFYNPAGLGFLEGLRFGSFYEPRFGASFGDLALVGRNFGLGLIFFNLGGIDQRDAHDNPVDEGTFNYGSSGTIGATGVKLEDLPFQLGLPKGLALGLTAKLYQVSTLESGNGSGLALDLGLLWAQQEFQIGSLPLELGLGATAENLLSLGVKYKNKHVDPWKMNLRLGAAVTARDLTLALDLETKGTVHLGAEYLFKGIGLERFGLGALALRVGGFTQGGLVLTFGLGIQLKNFHLDYAFVAYPQAPDTQRLSFAAEFTLPKLF